MSIRWRLAILYGLVTAVILLPAAGTAFSLHARSQYEDLDRSLVTTAEHFEAELRSAQSGSHETTAPVASDISVRLYHRTSDPAAIERASPPLLDPAQVLSRDDGPAYPAFAGLLGQESPRRGAFTTERDPATDQRVRLYALPAGNDGDLDYVLVWKPLQDLDESARFLGWVLAGVAFGGVAAAAIGTFVVAGTVLRPVSIMTSTARAISTSRGFTRRVPESGRLDELGRLARTFNEMLSSLEGAYRLQQRFVADAAHELRAPLTAIQGNIDLIKRHARMTAEERQEALDYLDGEARRLARIVSELLTLARADAGQTLERRPVELDRVLLDALAEMRPVVEHHQVEVGDIEPVVVSGDPDRLKEVALNLLDNSAKYTPSGGKIVVTLEHEAGDAKLTVRDEGIGMSADELAQVFDRFYRADPARSRDPGGSGLGLAIVRWIVDQHRGDIAVESEPGRGTMVVVRVPALVQQSTEAVEQQPARQRARSTAR